MEWFSEDGSIGMYGSTHLGAEVTEVERFLSALNPMIVMAEVHCTEKPNPDMQVAIDFARNRGRQVEYIGYSNVELAQELGIKHPMQTVYWFGITTCNQEFQNAASKEALRRTASLVLYNVLELIKINPALKADIFRNAISYVDSYIKRLWGDREAANTQQYVAHVTRGIEERVVEEPMDGFRQYIEKFQQ